MRIHFICCQVFYREISALCAVSPHITTVSWLPQGLHDTPELLRKSVAQEVSRVESWKEEERRRKPDYIVLGYGLCSNGTVGLQSGEIPLVIPRTDDCIGIVLGSQKRYLEAFRRYPGIYWVNNGWLEHGYVPTQEALAQRYARYVQDYGEDNARFLMEQDSQWQRSYTTAGYIASPLDRDGRCREAAAAMARFHGWNLVELEEDRGLLRRMVEGPWEEEEFLVCPPGWRIAASNDQRKIVALPTEGDG